MAFDTFQRPGCFAETSARLECVPGSLHFFQNVAGFGRPNVGLGLAVMFGDVVLDGLLQLPDMAKDAAPHALVGEIAKEALHLIEPGGTGGSEMQVEARMLLEPTPNLGRFMRRVVVQDQVDVLVARYLLVDQL